MYNSYTKSFCSFRNQTYAYGDAFNGLGSIKKKVYFISKFPPNAYLVLYLSSLSLLGLIVSAYLAMIMPELSDSPDLNTAWGVHVLVRFRICAYFYSIILGEFALESFCLIASA